MIHAMIHGTLPKGARYWPPCYVDGQSRQARAVFEVSASRNGVCVVCQIRGSRAKEFEPLLTAGARVTVSGELRIPLNAGPVRLDVDRCEVVRAEVPDAV